MKNTYIHIRAILYGHRSVLKFIYYLYHYFIQIFTVIHSDDGVVYDDGMQKTCRIDYIILLLEHIHI